MKKLIPLFLLSLLLFLGACDSESTNETTANSSTKRTSTNSTTSGSKVSGAKKETDTSSESDEKSFSQLDEIVGVWTNNDKEQTFAVTGRDYVSDDKKYEITGVDINDEEGTNKYVISWDTDLFVKEYGEPETFNPQPFIYDYNDEQDTLNTSMTFQRKTDDKQINYVKDQLAGNEPINLEQLLEVDDQHLLAYWYKSTTESDDLDEQLLTIYQEISIDYPDLKLLEDKEYEQYQSIAKEIEDSSGYSFSDLNTALPRDIYRWYTDLDKNDSEKERMNQLLPKIKDARKQYFERKKQSEQPYLDNIDETDNAEKTNETENTGESDENNENESDEPDEETQAHIREKIKEEFPEDMPKDHIVYDMKVENDQVNISVYENKEFSMQYQVGFVYDVKKDKLTKQNVTE